MEHAAQPRHPIAPAVVLPSVAPQSAKLAHIDALRGIAILLVILVHQGQVYGDFSTPLLRLSKYGQMGVQLFFVASAYTMCLSQHARRAETHQNLNFAIRRFFRIAPLYYLGIVIYATLRAYFPVGELSARNLNVGSILANALFVHDFIPSAINSVVPGGWSIGTEMVFYALFPAIWHASTVLFQRYGVAGLTFGCAISIVINSVAQILLLAITGHHIENNNFLYYNIINQLPVFMIGIRKYFSDSASSATHARRSAIFSCVGFITITGVIIAMWDAAAPLAFCALPWVAAISFTQLFEITTRISHILSPLQAVGRVSYSMYIFHFLPVWYISPLLKHTLSKLLPTDASFVGSLVISVILTYIIAQASKVVIEDRGTQIGRRLISGRTIHPSSLQPT